MHASSRVEDVFTYSYISRGAIHENVITLNISVDNLFAVKELQTL